MTPISEDEFLASIRVDRPTLMVWVSSGWLRPAQRQEVLVFSDIDLARARLITDLVGPLGVNADGVDIILDLLDQMHGLRAAINGIERSLATQPEDVQYRIRAEIRRFTGIDTPP